jgi:SNF2 family DNA or RNA helicase
MYDKPCGIVKRVNNDAYLKGELLDMVFKKIDKGEIDLMRSKARKMKLQDLCKLLKIKIYKENSRDKVCTPRKVKEYPFSYRKEELIEKAVKKLGITKTQAKKMKIQDLCQSLKIKFIDLPLKSPKKKVEEEEEEETKDEEDETKVEEDETKVEDKEYEEEEDEEEEDDEDETEEDDEDDEDEDDEEEDEKKEEEDEKKEETKEEEKENAKKDSICITRSKLLLKNHQVKVIDFLNEESHRGLLVIHSVGTGKTLTAVTVSQCFLDKNEDANVVVVTPTSLQENFKENMKKYGADPNDKRYHFYTIQSFSNATKAGEINCKNNLLILDEAHNIRTHITKGEGVNARHLLDCAKYAKKVLLLTATPLINKISDINNLMAMVNGMEPIPESAFKYMNNNIPELEKYFDCKISIYSPPEIEIKDKFPGKEVVDIFLKMSRDYLEKYEEIERNELDSENRNNLFGGTNDLTVFYNGVRRASNNLDEKMSPKIKWIMKKIKENRGSKFLIFSHFLDAGLGLMMSSLRDNDIEFEHVDGSMSISNRKKAVDKYNNGDVNILLISKAGGEGLDLKETKFVIILEPSWNDSTLVQVIGRAVRYESHMNLSKEDQMVYVYKLHMFKPKEEKFLESILSENKVESPINDSVLSVDLYLRNFSQLKQKVIDEFMEKIKKSSIEVKDCKDYGINYKDDFGERFAEEEKRQKEYEKKKQQEEKIQKEYAKQKERQDKQEEKKKQREAKQEEKNRQRQAKQEEKKSKQSKARKSRREPKNNYVPPPKFNYPPPPQSNSPNCEEIFMREGIIDSSFPPNITQEIKQSIKQKWKKWTILNHPDKHNELPPEEYQKKTEVFKEVTNCNELIMEDKYVPQQQGCNVM